MTTSENENEIIPVVRDLEVLLRLGTYQGMSDEEIDLLLDYKISNAVNDAVVQSQISAANYAATEVVARSTAASQQALDMLQSILNRPLPLQGVDMNG